MRGKKWSLVSLAVLAAALTAAFLALPPVRNRILEEWYIWKLDTRDRNVQFRAGERLVELHSVRAIPRLAALYPKEVGEMERAPLWIIRALIRLGPKGIDAAFRIRTDDDEVDAAVFAAIEELGPNARQAIPTLLAYLDRPDGYHATSCFRIIGEDAVIALVGVLKDGSDQARANAAEALGWIKDASAISVPALAAALRDANAEVREIAARALENSGTVAGAAVPELTAALRTEDTELRKRCASALRAIGLDAMAAIPDLIDLLDPGSEASGDANGALEAIDPGGIATVPLLLRKLEARSHSEIAVIRSFFSALTSFAGKSAEADAAILSGAHDPDLEIRRHTAWTLSKISGEKPRQALHELLRDADRQVRIWAAEGLTDLKILPDDAVPILVDALHDHQDVAAYLDQYGDRAAAAVPVLTALLDDPDSNVRERAREAVLKIRPAAPLALTRLLENLTAGKEENDSKKWVIQQIGELGPAASAAVPKLIPFLAFTNWNCSGSLHLESLEALEKIGESAVPHLIKALADQNKDIRRAAALALGKCKSQPPVIQALIKLLGDPQWEVRYAATESLGSAGKGSPEAMTAIVPLLKDADDDIRLAACEAIINLGCGPAQVLPVLLPFLGESKSSHNYEACSLIDRIGPPAREAVPALIHLLGKENGKIVRKAAQALGSIGKDAGPALPLLHEILRNLPGSDLSTSVAEAIKAIEP